MALPTISDFITYVGRLITGNNWNNNWQKLIDILTNGSYDLNVNQVTATSYIGVPGSQITGLIAGENISIGKLCYLNTSDGKLYLADQASVSTCDTLLGVAVDDYASGASVTVETSLYSMYSGLTLGYYYLGTSGQLLATAPITGIIKPVGIAVSTTTLKLFISPTNSIYYGAGWSHIIEGNDVVLKYKGTEAGRWIA